MTDPTGPSTGSNRVGRGGSWRNGGSNCRSANRNRNTPDNRNNNIGFRVAAAPAGMGWISRPAGTGLRPVLAPQGGRQTCDKRRRTLVGQTGGVPARRVPAARRHGAHLCFFEQTG
ncbi:MAG: SUMF1/EgtB/PvdO family nonheme iron enzyme [Verrucomicrobiota bacterium]